MARLFVDKFNLQYQKVRLEALQAACDSGKSIIYKTIQAIYALNQTGVLGAFTNTIFKFFLENNSKPDQPVDILEYETYLDNLISYATCNDSRYKDIRKFAYEMWNAVIASKDYKYPRDIAKTVIEEFNYSTRYNPHNLIISPNAKKKEEFMMWTGSWHYGMSEKDFKIKLLYIRLIAMEKINANQLESTTIQCSLNTQLLDLDHLEANNADYKNDNRYFSPSGNDEGREVYVNGLGNMMLLDRINNIKKVNRPLEDALGEDYKKMGTHWLITEIRDMLNDDNYSKEVLSGRKYRVPTASFFIERKKRIQKYFYAILELPFNGTTASIPN